MKTPNSRSLRIAILDSDPYSRSWTASLLMRDWRTRVAAELATYAQLKTFLTQSLMPVDFIIVDMDSGSEDYAFPAVLSLIQETHKTTRMIATSQKVDEGLLRLFGSSGFAAYLLKSEAQISLAWAARECSKGFTLITPGVEKIAAHLGLSLPGTCLVLEEKSAASYLSGAEQLKARLAFVMSMERDTLADELQLELTSVFTLISRLYENVGVNAINEDDNWFWLMSDEDPILKEKLQAFLENKTACPSKETVAFHLVTKPFFRKPD